MDLTSSADYFAFERQLLVCCWAIMKTKHLTIGHQVTMRPELPIMSWVLSKPASQDMHSSNPLSNGSGINLLGTEQVLKTQAGYMNLLPILMPMISTPFTMLSGPKHSPAVS